MTLPAVGTWQGRGSTPAASLQKGAGNMQTPYLPAVAGGIAMPSMRALTPPSSLRTAKVINPAWHLSVICLSLIHIGTRCPAAVSCDLTEYKPIEQSCGFYLVAPLRSAG